MSGNSLFFKQTEHKVCHLVVDNALADDCALLLAVERGCVVLVINNNIVGVVCCENLLRLALIKLLSLCVLHSEISFVYLICIILQFYPDTTFFHYPKTLLFKSLSDNNRRKYRFPVI